MRVLSFLILFSFISHPTSAHTIVLKSGKLIEGEFLGEDESTIQIKDFSGILLSVKKNSIDLEATRLKNSAIDQPESMKSSQVSNGKVSKTVVQIAAENRQRRDRGKAYTKEDLSGLPELSIIGSEDSDLSDIPPIEESVELPSKAELYWRKEGIALKKRLESLREKIAGVEEACNQARHNGTIRRAKPHTKAIDLLPMMDEPAVCKKQAELLRQLEETQDRWDDFEVRARRAGVPWAWLE